MATTATPAVHRRKRFPLNTGALALGAATDVPPAVEERLSVDTERHGSEEDHTRRLCQDDR